MTTRIHAVLHEHPLFNELHSIEPRLLETIKLRNFNKNDVIYRPGAVAQYAYLIVTGSIRFDFSSNSGQQIFVGVMDKGFVFGELELLSEIEYHSTATANENTEVLLIPKNTLFELMTEHPAFGMKFTRQLATNFYFFLIIVAEHDASDLKANLANLLISIAIRFGQKKENNITFAISHDQLSNMLNVSRQRVNLQLNKWQAAGLIQCHYGQITIEDINNFSEHSGLAKSVVTNKNYKPFQG